MGHPGEVPGQVLHAEDNDWDRLDNWGLRGWGQQEEEVEVLRRGLLRKVVRVEQPVNQLQSLQQGRLRLATLQ